MTALRVLYNVNDTALLQWVAKTFGLGQNNTSQNVNRQRRAAIAQRLRLYRDDAAQDFRDMIDTVFETPGVQEQRKKMIQVASEQNVSRRIIDEVYSLYDQPASRRFVMPAPIPKPPQDASHLSPRQTGGSLVAPAPPLSPVAALDNDPDDALTGAPPTIVTNTDLTARFKEIATVLELDEVMQEAHRLKGLCNEVLLWLVKPETGDTDTDPEMHIVTPDAFDAIPNPLRPLQAGGFLIDSAPTFVPIGADAALMKNYELWDDTFVYALDANGGLVTPTEAAPNPREHHLGKIPGILLHRRKPVDRILDSRAGADIVSGHLGTVLLEVMIMRLSKSQGEQQPVLQGNLANAAAGQSMDGEKPLLLPPEVVASILNTKTDPDHYLKVKGDKLVALASTYGISWQQFTYDEGETSGKAYIVRRLKLIELRNEQRRRARIEERAIVKLLGFDPASFRVDHQEQSIPQDAVEEVQLLTMKIELGLDSAVAFLMRKDPDLTEDEAFAGLTTNAKYRGVMAKVMRSLNIPNDPAQSGQDPQFNGSGKIIEKLDPGAIIGDESVPPPVGGAQQPTA